MKQRAKIVGYGMLGGVLLVVLGAIPGGAAPCHVPSSAYTTIQAAVNAATTCATINMAAGTYTENVLIDHAVTIRGEGQGSTIVNGGGSGTVFTITSGTVTIKGVTIQNGLGSLGGGIFNTGTLTVKNSLIADNRADLGGGIVNFGMLTVQNSTIADNQASENGGGLLNFGTVTLTHVTFQNNTPNDCAMCP